MSISLHKTLVKKNKLLKELALKNTYNKKIVQQSCQRKCRLIRTTIEGNWIKCYNFGRNVTILLLGSINKIYVYIYIYIYQNLEIFYSLIGSWVIMIESCHLLMFWGTLCFISGKSFLFHKSLVLTEGKQVLAFLTYLIIILQAEQTTYAFYL